MSSSTVASLLNDMSSALNAEQFENAETIADDLRQEYEARSEEDEKRVSDARSLLSDTDSVSVENINELASVIQFDGTTRILRSILFIMVSALADSSEELRQEGELEPVLKTAKAAVEELKEAEPELSDASDDADTIIDDTELPPNPIIQSISVNEETVGVGEEATVSVTVGNIGDSRAENVNLSFNPTEKVSVEQDAFSLGSISSGDSVTRETEAIGSSEGPHAIEVSTEDDNNNSDRSQVILSVVASEDESERQRRRDRSREDFEQQDRQEQDRRRNRGRGDSTDRDRRRDRGRGGGR